MASGPDGSPLIKRLRGGTITTATLRDATNWDTHVTDLGIAGLIRHGLRHTALTWMADSGVLLHVLQRVAGHQDSAMTPRYLHPDHRALTSPLTSSTPMTNLPDGVARISTTAPRDLDDAPSLRLLAASRVHRGRGRGALLVRPWMAQCSGSLPSTANSAPRCAGRTTLDQNLPARRGRAAAGSATAARPQSDCRQVRGAANHRCSLCG
ncbi:tyrosine-type recombinase/integrase [Promicromonospora sukumoe]